MQRDSKQACSESSQPLSHLVLKQPHCHGEWLDKLRVLMFRLHQIAQHAVFAMSVDLLLACTLADAAGASMLHLRELRVLR